MSEILRFLKKNRVISLMILIAFISQMAIVFPYGKERCIQDICGIFFADIYRAHDDLWHISIANTAFSTFPFRMPIFAGVPLIGYHYLYAFVVHVFNIIGISAFLSYYTLMPIVWFVLYTFLSIIVARRINDSPKFIGSFLFFQYFAGSFSYILRLFHFKNIWHPSINSANQPGELMINQHLAFSFVFILAILLLIGKRKFMLRDAVISGVLLFLGWGMKFYGAVAMLSLLLIFSLFSLFKKRFSLRLFIFYILLFLGSSLLSIIFFYNPFSSLNTGAIFEFSPFSTVHYIIEEKNMFYLKDMVNARYYLYERGIGPRLVAIEIFSLILYVFFSFGTRIIGFFYIGWRTLQRTLSEFEITVIMSGVFVASLSVIFIQKGDWFNTRQFMHCAMFLTNIFAAHVLYSLLIKKRFLYSTVAFLIILLTIHNSIDYIRKYSSPNGSVYISTPEIDALRTLEKQPDGTVFSLPFINSDIKLSNDDAPPLPLTETVDSAYIPAFTGKQTWYSDAHQLKVTGIDYHSRERELLDIESLDPTRVQSRYFYLDKKNKYFPIFYAKTKKANLNKIFENKRIMILESM